MPAKETLNVRAEGAVLFAEINAPPMNLLGPELVAGLVSVIQRAEGDDAVQVLVFTSADPDYFISHVDVTRISEYRESAAKLTGEPALAEAPVRAPVGSWRLGGRLRRLAGLRCLRTNLELRR
jgi:enoyl-CoA hydratase/carnithine racemase